MSVDVPGRHRKFWGWGYEGEGLTAAEVDLLTRALADRLQITDLRPADPPTLAELTLRVPRVQPPSSLAAFCSLTARDRAEHTLGKSFHDLLRGLQRQYVNPPDFVAYPGTEEQLLRLLEWATDARVAAIPYGGGSSVTGGVEPDVGDDYVGAVSIDMRLMARVLEVDHESRAALIEAGILGPALEEQLRPHGLTLRHFPQSF